MSRRVADLPAKTRGEAKYAADLIGSETAIAGFVRSPFAHARVLSVDVRDALSSPGALGVLTGSDFEGLRLGTFVADQPVLAEDRVRYAGEPIVAVAAENTEALRRAIAAVRVRYEPLPIALTPEAAMAEAFPIHAASPDNVAMSSSTEHGDWAAATAGVAVWAEDEFDLRPVWHAYMEPYAALARYEPSCITLHAAMHSPHQIKEQYARWAKRWEGLRLEIATPVIGGSFGAKYEHAMHLVCAEFAQRLRRDVGSVLSRREDFLQATPRVGMRLRVRIGASAEGRLLAKETDLIADNGAYSLDAPFVFGAATVRIDNLYRFEAVRAKGKLVYTNTPPTQCFRGFGSPQSAFAQEQLVDAIARELGMSPFEMRRRNAVREGDVTVHGWRIGACGLSECLDAVEARVGEAQVGEGGRDFPSARLLERDPGGRFSIGFGVAAGTHVISNRSAATEEGDRARVRMRVTPQGRVQLFSSEVEVGAGTVRVFAKLAADRLGVEPCDVEVTLGDTRAAPFGLGSFASRTAFFAGNAILDGTARLIERLDGLRGELSLSRDAPLADVSAAAVAAGRIGELEVAGDYVAEGVEPHDEGWHGNVSPSYTFAVHACAVRVDTWTGRVEVLRYWAAHDAGTILNVLGARGQVYGGIMQGLGYALFEEALLDRDGRASNPGFLDYRIPTFPDRVPIEIIFADTYEKVGPLGAKSIAEPPIIPVAACVANAVHDATGTRLRRLPMQPETVLEALRGS